MMSKRRQDRDVHEAQVAPLVDELNRMKSDLAVVIADRVSKGGIAAASSPEIEAAKQEIRELTARIEQVRENLVRRRKMCSKLRRLSSIESAETKHPWPLLAFEPSYRKLERESA